MAIISVTQLNMLIQREISFNPYLKQLEVEAEIGRLTKHASGHLYFTIKDAFSSIDCVMFRSQANKMKQRVQEGDRVIVKGQISLYEKTARLQLYVQSIEPIGDGVFLKAFQELKQKLEREGLLDESNKRPIPRYPKKLALLTSATGAARADFLKVFYQKNPFCQVVDMPVAVQGENVPASIMTALDQLDHDTELVVITRGGGSYEDLRFFNDEALARRVFELDIPTICAIGHEVDFTIIEFVADLRAATPTAAADGATADVRHEFLRNEKSLIGFADSFARRIDLLQERLQDRFLNHFQFRMEKRAGDMARTNDEFLQAIDQTLKDRFARQQRYLDRLLTVFQAKTHYFKTDLQTKKQTLDQSSLAKLRQADQTLEHFGLFLNHTNPLQILGRGYSYLEQDGNKIQSVNDINSKKPIINHLKDGRIISTVTEVEHEL